MSQMIKKGEELIRISTKKAENIEYSKNDGRTWTTRYSGTSYGTFLDLTDNGREILAQTSEGLYYSKNDGRTWTKRN